MRQRAWVATLGAALLVFGVAGSALAHEEKFESDVVITEFFFDEDNDLVVKDQVFAEHEKCVGGRKVTLKRKRQGPDQTVGEDRTSNDGRSKIVVKNPRPGTYYEKLKKDEFGHGDNHVCKGARSQEIEVD
jgi:hypothetical protein